jgi:hypothetical protein
MGILLLACCVCEEFRIVSSAPKAGCFFLEKNRSGMFVEAGASELVY